MMLVSIYRRLFPLKLRTWIYKLFFGKFLFLFRNVDLILRSKFTFIFGFILPENEGNKALSFIGKYGITSYPGDYVFDYKCFSIEVRHDSDLNLPYVIHKGNKLYFPEFWSAEKIEKEYRALLIEQDPRCAHRYVQSYEELRGMTLLDVGSAEGIFALDTIDFINEVIIFECEEFWLTPLKATFAPWLDKVRFVEKYVGNETHGKYITLDDFLKETPKENLFFKMDIEGTEREALKGAENLLKESKAIRFSICTYHQAGDPEFMESLMKTYGFNCEFSDGLLCWNKRLSKGVIRCFKS